MKTLSKGIYLIYILSYDRNEMRVILRRIEIAMNLTLSIIRALV